MTATRKAKACCLLFVLVLASVLAQAQPVANFTATPLSGCAPLVVQFSDQSTGSPTQWRWDLGNGTISFLQNPAVTYFNPGQYNIKLVVRNAQGADSIVKSQYITVNAGPTVAFTATPVTGCYPLPVQFTDQSTPGSGNITSWEWDFGDGNSATTQNPSHTYMASGNYNVTLRIRNSAGCIRTLTKPQYIQINNGVTANFTNSIPNSCNPPATINFQNLSTGTGALSYQWSFGDGGTSVLPNPAHAYNNPGSYTVTLIVTNATGCTDTIVRNNAITIGSVAGAFTGPTSACSGSPVSFTNTSSPAPSSATWTFGDGNTQTAINGSNSYTTPGTYTVKMVANFGACTDSAFSTITILAKPVANFSAPATTACKAPFTVNFTNNSTGGASFAWDFGDGNTSTAANPAHTYNSTGSFNVTLVVTGANGCTDSLRQSAFINITAPDVQLNNLPVRGCAPLTHVFSATTSSIDPVVSYSWDFGDGNTGSGANPSHTYANAGDYTVTVVITTAGGCTDTARLVNAVIVGTKPVPNFSATPRNTCARNPVSFTDLSTGNITQWLWDFGDGSGSTAQNPQHEYQDTGYFNVQLIVSNNGCSDTIRFNNYIYIQPPIARFSKNFACGSPRSFTFTDQSVGADTWLWSFGDGTTSTLQNPTHTYADTGNYIITLTVTNLASGCDHRTSQTIRIVDEKANFTASDTIICKGSMVTFTAIGNTPANVSGYSWNFGDGNTGTGGVAYHYYYAAGTYTVTLNVTDISGCITTMTKPLYIRVDGPTASFSPTVPGSCLNTAISFTDNSYGDGQHPITTWIWQYGDGLSDTLTSGPFQHTYAGPGIYTVSLKVIDSKGCADSNAIGSALIISKPVAGFNTPDTLSCPNRPINFSSTSTGPNLSYFWDFGDGNTATGPDPIHNYLLDGNYTIKLRIVDQYGCTDSISRSAYVKIITPIANFSMSDSLSTCPPLLVQFTNTSTISNTINWDFGDGTSAQIANPSHFYSYPGVFNVVLTVTGPGGCTDTRTKQVVVRGPSGTFTYNPLTGCNPLTIGFTATTIDRISFIWDFNDGTTTPTPDSVISHTYTNPGVYLPKMILVDAGGCQVPITGLDTIRVNGVNANFGMNGFNLCDSGYINFSDSSVSNDVIVGYNWLFGDGAQSTQRNPTHYYNTTGLYYPQLIVTTQSGCRDTVIQPAPVKITASPQAVIQQSPNGCAPVTISFTPALAIPDTSAMQWQWNFGNGNTGTGSAPAPQVYSNPAVYTIQLLAINSSGCRDTVTQTVEAFRIPVVGAGPDTLICQSRGIGLSATGADSYAWSPGNGLSCLNCTNPTATPDSVTDYIVRGTTNQGCSATDTVKVRVIYPFNMNASRGDTLCKGESLQLFANGADRYRWSPAAGLSNPAIANPRARPDQTTTYQVIGTDQRGCFSDTALIPIRVYPIPTVNAGDDKTINIGQSIDLVPVLSPDVTGVLWSPTSGIFRTNYPAITVKPRETTQYMVEVRNDGGCTARDQVTVFVICTGANVFIPNTFSPNGDGANDVFYPRGTGLFSIKTLRIFNRWGEVVFEKNNFNPNDAASGWNGTYKGVRLTPDVYVYTADILCDNSTVLTLKGNVALIQ